jgi:hypothetical protein
VEKEWFRIVCIENCESIGNTGRSIRMGESFLINNYEYNYGGKDHLRLEITDRSKIYDGLYTYNALYKKIYFVKLPEWRNIVIDNLLDN